MMYQIASLSLNQGLYQIYLMMLAASPLPAPISVTRELGVWILSGPVRVDY